MKNFKRSLLKRSIEQGKIASWSINTYKSLTMDELSSQATQGASIFFNSPICVLLLLKDNNLHIQGSVGIEEKFLKHKRIAIGESISGRLIKRGIPKLFSSIPDYLTNIKDNLETYYSGSMISTPLAFNKKIIGLLNLCRPSTSLPFIYEELHRLINLGHQLAFAIASQKLVDSKTLELKENEEKYRILFETAPEGIIITNLYGEIIDCNTSICKIKEEKKEHLLNKIFFDLNSFFPQDSQKIKKVFNTYSPHETDRLGDFLIMVDNQKKWIEIFYSPLKKNGEIYAYQFIIQDITERKRTQKAIKDKSIVLKATNLKLEQEIREKKLVEEKLRKSNQELEEFAYIASHDLQEPLRMVSSYLQLIKRCNKDKFDDSSLEFLDFAVDGAVRMKQLINDLLSYSRAGNKEGNFKEIDCTLVLGKVLKNLEFLINESKAIVTFDPLPLIKADPVQIGQLLQNLIDNAIKFCKLNIPKIHISATQDKNSWIFSVKDNGIGISSKNYKRIFQIFQRLHSRKDYDGTGIGLAICKKIVECHKGEIWLQSQKDAGSSFFFSIPI